MRSSCHFLCRQTETNIMNPYETPCTSNPPSDLALQSDQSRSCPVCGARINRWEVWNFVRACRCQSCGARVHWEVERPLRLWYALGGMACVTLAWFGERFGIGGDILWDSALLYSAYGVCSLGGVWLQIRYGRLKASGQK